MSELTCHASEALNDIGHLGDILDALDCIPEDKADSEYLLRGAAAIGRRIVSLSIEASEQFELSANARCAREALSDLRGFGEIIAALDSVPASKNDSGTLLCASAALGRCIASMAIEAEGAPRAGADVVEALLAAADILDAAENGAAPDTSRGSIYAAFLKAFRTVEHGGVRLDGRFWSCAAMQPLHGEQVAVFIPKVGHLTRLMILDLDGGLIGVAKPEPAGASAAMTAKASQPEKARPASAD
ncbi:MAG: hypothetical protein WBO09_17915 [Methylocystis silviterrae]|uniref:hypothetical protein n=1 Tax=Methylocystis silviterrae TaxID=2743612 RepID=UPI003C73B193